MFVPFGDYYCVRPLPIAWEQLNGSWDLEQERVDGISSRDCGIAAAVTKRSRQCLQVAVECIAWYFRREFDYDFVQYCAAEKDDVTRPVTYLWADEGTLHNGKITTFGACCFRWREFRDHDPGYALDFAWLHPYQRMHGVLSRAWPYFRARFGQDFYVQPPLSIAMVRFLAKQEHLPFGIPLDRFPCHEEHHR